MNTVLLCEVIILQLSISFMGNYTIIRDTSCERKEEISDQCLHFWLIVYRLQVLQRKKVYDSKAAVAG